MKENIQPMDTKTKIPKLKGKTTILVKNAETGEVEQKVEEENMVTNAVAAIFANNFANGLDTADDEITPISHLFGGVMCFNQQLTENANRFFPPTQGENALIAHAGSSTEAAHANPKLGARTMGTKITNGWRWKWEWSTAQGIGNISSCALTSEAGGNVGLTPITRDFPATIFKSLRNIETPRAVHNTLDEAKTAFMTYNKETGIGKAIFYNSTKVNNVYEITEVTLKHPTLKFGLQEGADDWEVINTRTVTTATNMGNTHAFYADGDNYYLLYRASSKRAITGYKLEPSEDTFIMTAVSFGPYQDTTITFAPLPYDFSIRYEGMTVMGVERSSARYGAIPIHNGYIYFLSEDQTKLYRIQVNSPSNITEITTEVADQVFHLMEPAYWCGDICVGFDFIINSVGTTQGGEPIEKLYPISNSEHSGGAANYWHHFNSFADTPALLDMSRTSDTGSGSGYVGYQGVGIFAPYLATINNLSQTVNKSPNQTMEIIYDLTLAE